MTVHVNGDVAKLEREFLDFHHRHPEVYVELVRLARELRARGYRKFGIATIYEVARWRSMLRRSPADAFRLNNNHRAFYARMMMQREPDLRGLFQTRQQGVVSHVA